VGISLEVVRPKTQPDLVRVGAECDGGYVLSEKSIDRSRYLLSFGINEDWSFELDFINRSPRVEAFCFDHSVSKRVFFRNAANALNEIFSPKFAILVGSLKLRRARQKIQLFQHCTKTYREFHTFLAKRNVHFYAKGISSQSSASFVTFAEAFHLIEAAEIPENSVFVKMDIEQSEFRVIPDLLKFERYINGLVVEFHDLDILWVKFGELIANLGNRFEIIHVHGNNYGGLIPNSSIPKFLELSFLKKDLVDLPTKSERSVSYPIDGLDFANNPSERDYPLLF
jgi:hypothetical protein